MPSTLQQRRLVRWPKTVSSRAVGLWRADSYDSVLDAFVDLSGRGHHMVLGSAVGADSNDPRRDIFSGVKYLKLPGTASNRLSVPDSAALSITGDITVGGYHEPDDSTPAAIETLVSKFTVAGDQRSYAALLETAGGLRLSTSPDGITTVVASSTAAVPSSGGFWWWSTRDVNVGGLSNRTRFFTSLQPRSTAIASLVGTQLGADVDNAILTAIFVSTASLEVGAHSAGATAPFAGIVDRAFVTNAYSDDGTIKGTVALDIDTSKATASPSTFTEDSANAATVTINRSATGRKSVVVDRTLALFGTDDYCETPDHADFNFAAGESFTVVCAWRAYGAGGATIVLAKKAGQTASVGWELGIDTSNRTVSRISDGTNQPVGISATSAWAPGVVSAQAVVRSVQADTLQQFDDGVASGAAVADSTTDTLANAEVVRLGRYSGAGASNADMEFIGAACFRSALSAADLQRLANEQGWA